MAPQDICGKGHWYVVLYQKLGDGLFVGELIPVNSSYDMLQKVAHQVLRASVRD